MKPAVETVKLTVIRGRIESMSTRDEMTQLDRIEAKLNYLMIRGFGWPEFEQTNAELDQWVVPDDAA